MFCLSIVLEEILKCAGRSHQSLAMLNQTRFRTRMLLNESKLMLLAHRKLQTICLKIRIDNTYANVHYNPTTTVHSFQASLTKPHSWWDTMALHARVAQVVLHRL